MQDANLITLRLITLLKPDRRITFELADGKNQLAQEHLQSSKRFVIKKEPLMFEELQA